MGTSASSLGSTSSTSSAATIAALLAPQTFVGVSQYSGDLQSVLTRAVQIAQLPITAMQSEDEAVVSKVAALGSLQSDVNAVAADLTNLSTLAAGQALTATSSDSKTVTATIDGNMTPTSYTISNITSIAAAASETSTRNFPDASTTTVSPSGTMVLTLGSQTATIKLTNATNNLAGLENAINTATDAQGNSIPVTASIITSADNTDYLSVTANSPGATTLTLTEGASGSGADFLTSSNQGTNTDFTLNNSIAVDNPSTTISDVIPGVTLNILQANPGGVGKVTVSLTSDPTQLSNALNTFVSDYNTLLTAVGAQTGQGGGALVGDPILSSIEGAMQQLVSSQGTGAVGDLYDLGIQMGDNGQMTLDSTVVNGFSASQLQSAFAWLGSTTKGLASFAANFTALGDPNTGAIQSEVSGYNTTDQNLQSQMLVKATQVSQMQASLQLQLAAQDTLIANLESQQNMLNTTIEAMNYSTYGYQSNPNG
ncbi:MAG: flagellar filament capping protein FliD [Bryobacteraceae bacterium]|jgi:flagellar hook-associated protein 2